MSDEIGLLHSRVDGLKDRLVSELQGVLRIPSKQEPAAGPNAPFGRRVREALDYTLVLCHDLGFHVKDVDGYAAHAEFGEGAQMVAALGHLDVVPEGDGWSFPPFGAEIHDGFIYARGSSDDKGPTYAALFAAKALMDSGLTLNKRVRIIFGCNEESGFGCVKHYWDVAKQERPALAFTPDAHFPLIYAEKGITDLVLERRVEPSQESPLRVVWARGGLRPNMVPASADARIEGSRAQLHAALLALIRFWDKNVSFEADPTGITVHSAGKSGHGSTPQVGDNAIARLARALLEIDLPADREWLDWIDKTVDYTGRKLGIRGEDEVAGPLTNNLGLLDYSNGLVRLTYNIRYPVTWTFEKLLEKHKPVIDKAGWTLVNPQDSPPLYVPLDQEPVKTLLRIYREETGDCESEPETTGGGTYARATPNAVAFGAAFPNGPDGPAHEPDERISIDNLIKATKIYAHALYELAK